MQHDAIWHWYLLLYIYIFFLCVCIDKSMELSMIPVYLAVCAFLAGAVPNGLVLQDFVFDVSGFAFFLNCVGLCQD